MSLELLIAILVVAVWIYLLLFRGWFWLRRESDAIDPPLKPQCSAAWPRVAVVVPARDEAAVLPLSLPSLLAQDYAQPLTVIVVDDQSEDCTFNVARSIASRAGREVVVLRAEPRPPGWTGKVWA